MNCFLWRVPGFPALCANVWLARAFGYNPGHTLTIKVWGVGRERDEWQRAFDLWCHALGERPAFTRGNVRTGRTEARVVLIGDSPILAFLTDWMGLNSLHPQASRSRRMTGPSTNRILSDNTNDKQPNPEDFARLSQLLRKFGDEI